MVNLKYAFRTLLKTPFVTTVAILSLALGIGATGAIFSMYEEILRSPLPVPAPSELVNLAAPGPKQGSTSCNQAGDCDEIFSNPMFRDLAREQSTMTGLAAHRLLSTNLAYDGRTSSAEALLVSGSYFFVLGVRPALGRLLGPDDDRNPGEHFVAVLSYGYWETELGADPGVLDRTLIVNGHPMTIVGVAPRGFTGNTLGARPQVFVPIAMRGVLSALTAGLDNRRVYWAYLFGRLKPGVTIEQADADLNRIYSGILSEVEAPLQEGMSEQTLERFRARRIVLEPGWRGQSSVHGEATTPLLLLFSVTGVVLLIACANIANLLLARGAARAPEISIRAALGAGRGTLLGQLLTEACLLAALGGIASLLVAFWTLAFIKQLLPPEATATIPLDLQPSVLGFAAAASLGTGLLFGIYPALHSTRPDLVSALKASGGQPSGARAAARFRTALVTAQIALSMTLLMLSGLFLRSLVNVHRIDLGLQPENVVMFALAPQLSGYSNEESRALFERVEEELAAISAVSSVSAALVPVIGGNSWGTDVHVEGFESGPDIDSNSRYNEVGADFFRTLGMTLLAGRDFTRFDDVGSQGVVVVNEAFTRKFGLKGVDAIGKRVSTDGPDLDLEIVGVARDASYSDVKSEVPPLLFLPYRQDEDLGYLTFYARTAGETGPLISAVRDVVRRLDPDLPIENLKTLEQQVTENVFLDRMITVLSGSFAALATLLAAIGLYGVLAYTVAQRTREIGLRIALGAGRRRVRWLVMRQVALMTLLGGAVGVGGAILLARAAGSLLYGMEGLEPGVMTAVALFLTVVSGTAAYVPALRASRVEPMEALRYE